MKRSLARYSAVTWIVFCVLLGTTMPVLADEPTDYFDRPIPMGVSISPTPTEPYIMAGTAGMLVQRPGLPGGPPAYFILSNAHVLSAVAPTICPGSAPPLTRILQPGTLDIGADPGRDWTYIVGLLTHASTISFNPLFFNLTDAAIALTSLRFSSPDILGIGTPTAAITTPVPGMEVVKSGRTSGVTSGTVEAVNVSAQISYQDCGTARFTKQVVFDLLSSAGDSGAVILDAETLTPVALLFAGSDTITIGNAFTDVVDALNIFPVGNPPPEAGAAAQTDRGGMRAAERAQWLQQLQEIQQRHEEDLLLLPHVAGMGIAASKDRRRYEFVIYVETLDTPTLSRVPEALEDIPVRIIKAGPFVAF